MKLHIRQFRVLQLVEYEMRTYLYMRSIYSEYINLRNPQFLISPLGSEWSFEPYCHCHSVLINYFFFFFLFCIPQQLLSGLITDLSIILPRENIIFHVIFLSLSIPISSPSETSSTISQLGGKSKTVQSTQLSMRPTDWN